MITPTSTERDLTQLLKQLGCDWMDRGCWTVEAPPAVDPATAISVQGPAFTYRWQSSDSPVAVSFIGDGPMKISPGESLMLVVEVGRGTIRVLMGEQSPFIVGAIEAVAYQQIAELVADAQTCCRKSEPAWRQQMALLGGALRLIALTSEVAAATNIHECGAKHSPKKDQLVTLLHEWLRPNLANSVKLGDAAKHFGKSPRQLIRILKETTGAGFAEHLTMHRLTLARALLMRSDQSVMEVARSSGFNSREQFIRSFNKAFGWTPLQFRKAWNHASLSDHDLVQLCQVSERRAVKWKIHGETSSSPQDDQEGKPHTVVVANALHEIVELFWVSPLGKRVRIDVLERGGMVFVNRDNGGSSWIVRAPGSGFERNFVTSDDHAIAIISSDLRPPPS